MSASRNTIDWASVGKGLPPRLRVFAKKKLAIKGSDVDLSLNVTGGMFEIPNNVDGAKKLAETWQCTKALPA